MTSLSEHQKMADLNALAREAIDHDGSDTYCGATATQLAAAFVSHPDLWDISFAKTVELVDDGVIEVPAQPGDAGAYATNFTVSDAFIDALRSDLANGGVG